MSAQQRWEFLGGIRDETGAATFRVWAPNVRNVSVVGEFNAWDGRVDRMKLLGDSGVWEARVLGLPNGALYKFELHPHQGPPFLKCDPWARWAQLPPATASRLFTSDFRWSDAEWMCARSREAAASIYELHPQSFKKNATGGFLTWIELALEVVNHVKPLRFSHVELMGVAEHPFGGSWGYQVSGYFAPTARHGSPDEFRTFVDILHQHQLGVIIDWVPAHFPHDDFSLARFDGTALYEHEDPKRGFHPDWGTAIFNLARHEVSDFLLANALYWLEEFHLDGLRVDAVASMLYRDYSRKPGEWVPNQHGGRENEEAVTFFRALHELVHERAPQAMIIAEESTAWPKVTESPLYGGLGFSQKWNMGWMHDVLSYFSKEAIHRKHHHHQLTFGLLYAWSEKFVLPLSHDEVVHEKRSLLSKMPGDEWQRFANLRALYSFMWAHPGRKLLFMGGEFGQVSEWNEAGTLDWASLEIPKHRQVMHLVGRLNELYLEQGALFESDDWPQGFEWIQANCENENVFSFVRRGKNNWREVICVANLSPVVRAGWRLGVPRGGLWAEILNSDAVDFGGSGVTNSPQLAQDKPWDGQPGSIELTLPPLGVLWLQTL
jgi:1,4-alpha-glucan branching enzyme